MFKISKSDRMYVKKQIFELVLMETTTPPRDVDMDGMYGMQGSMYGMGGMGGRGGMGNGAGMGMGGGSGKRVCLMRASLPWLRVRQAFCCAPADPPDALR
jgi:hypothetical protein